MESFRFDEVGYWTELKLEILQKYAQPYSLILSKKKLKSYYIDAFAGAGTHISKNTGELIKGSPIKALDIKPRFDGYFFIDIVGDKIVALKNRVKSEYEPETEKTIKYYRGDANEILIKDVFPLVRWEDYRRALCLLDPYKLQMDWRLIKLAGQMKSVEIFLNFPTFDMNRNILWRNPDGVSQENINRMNRYWGDDTWKNIAYQPNGNLDLFEERTKKVGNQTIADAFRDRLKTQAGFEFVPEPIPMRNSNGSVIYYLFFASPNETGSHIVNDIFMTYRNAGRL